MTRLDWVLGQEKFLSPGEVKRLIRSLERRAQAATTRGRKVPVRDYFTVHIALATGLRVMELAGLKCGDLHIREPMSSLMVRRGKGGRPRIVRFNGALSAHCQDYLLWKQSLGEPTGVEDPLLLSSNTGAHMTTRAIQKAFKRAAAQAGLPGHYSIHCLRHTYACELYRASGYNLRLVQKQLGHASIRTTEVYADVMDPDLRRSLQRLYA